MTTLAVLVLLLAAPQDPVVHESKVILRTSKGDLRLVLFPEVAPRHVAHFLRLVRSGYYDGTRFTLVMPGYVVQHGGHLDRLRVMTPDQERLSKERIPAEFGRLHHDRGKLSMARDKDDVDSATTSFMILLGDAPNLDGSYTVFGRVEKGLGVLDAFGAVEVSASGAPKQVLNVHRAFVEGDLPAEPHDFNPPPQLLYLGGAVIAAGLAAFLLAGRMLPRNAGPIGLSLVIAGFFVGFVAATPRVLDAKESRQALALVVFLSMLLLFKLMNRFESPRT